MVIWILFALMTAGLLAAVLSPLLAPAVKARSHVLSSADVYRAQLSELERERGEGRLGEEAYLSARAEIGRRLIKASDNSEDVVATAPEPAKRKMPLLALVLAVAVPAFVLSFYLYVGSPDLADQPLAARGPEVAQAREVMRLMGELEAKLKAGQGDATGWMLLGSLKSKLGDDAAAVEAYTRSIAELKKAGQVAPAALQVALGEAMMAQAQGQFTPRALEAFRAAVAVEPKHVGARFYLAEARARAGDAKGAAEDFRALLADAPKDAPYRPMLESRINALEQQGK